MDQCDRAVGARRDRVHRVPATSPDPDRTGSASPHGVPRPAGRGDDMTSQALRVLISGASVAGPMAAYWLGRQGFAVTVVERMPLARVRTSGHAVDLFGPAMDVADWTGVLPAVIDARTRTEIVSFQRDNGRGVEIEMRRLVAGISGRHVEIMRGELASILYEATRSRRPVPVRGLDHRRWSRSPTV